MQGIPAGTAASGHDSAPLRPPPLTRPAPLMPTRHRPQVAAVVSQPGKPKGRGNKGVPTPSPVEALARSAGLPDDRILCPK